MKLYRTTRPTTLLTGSIWASENQAKLRQHCLRPVADGEFLVVGACNFIAGEVFGLEISEPVAKSLGLELIEIEQVAVQPDQPAETEPVQAKPKRRGRKPA